MEVLGAKQAGQRLAQAEGGKTGTQERGSWQVGGILRREVLL